VAGAADTEPVLLERVLGGVLRVGRAVLDIVGGLFKTGLRLLGRSLGLQVLIVLLSIASPILSLALSDYFLSLVLGLVGEARSTLLRVGAAGWQGHRWSCPVSSSALPH